MNTSKKNLCVFIHFSNAPKIPYYVALFVTELTRHFDELIFVGNARPLQQTPPNIHKNVTFLWVDNEGYDLGMFYKVFQTINLDDYKEIACVNDSNILFNTLDSVFNWGRSQNVDFWGLIDSHQKPSISVHQENYHLQSHFMVFNQQVIEKLAVYFNRIDVEAIIKEKDILKCRNAVINYWEIGLSQFLIKEGLTCKSYIDSEEYSQKYLSSKKTNISIKLYREMAQHGYPLVKKKVITRSVYLFWRQLKWKKTIRQFGNPAWNIEHLIEELVQLKNESHFLHKLKRKLIK